MFRHFTERYGGQESNLAPRVNFLWDEQEVSSAASLR